MNHNFLTREEIAKVAPAVVEMNAAPDVSDKYTHVPTIELIDDMETLGWKVVRQAGTCS